MTAAVVPAPFATATGVGRWPTSWRDVSGLGPYLVLAALLHGLLVALVGSAPPGTAPPGEGSFGAINIILRGLPGQGDAAPGGRQPTAPAGPVGRAEGLRWGGAVRDAAEPPPDAVAPGAPALGEWTPADSQNQPTRPAGLPAIQPQVAAPSPLRGQAPAPATLIEAQPGPPAVPNVAARDIAPMKRPAVPVIELPATAALARSLPVPRPQAPETDAASPAPPPLPAADSRAEPLPALTAPQPRALRPLPAPPPLATVPPAPLPALPAAPRVEEPPAPPPAPQAIHLPAPQRALPAALSRPGLEAPPQAPVARALALPVLRPPVVLPAAPSVTAPVLPPVPPRDLAAEAARVAPPDPVPPTTATAAPQSTAPAPPLEPTLRSQQARSLAEQGAEPPPLAAPGAPAQPARLPELPSLRVAVPARQDVAPSATTTPTAAPEAASAGAAAPSTASSTATSSAPAPSGGANSPAAPTGLAAGTAAPLAAGAGMAISPGAGMAGDARGSRPPSAAASGVPLNLELPRTRGGMVSSEGSRGVLQLMPRPAETRSKLARDIEKAGKEDCREAYAGMGLLAVPMLAVDALRTKGCKW